MVRVVVDTNVLVSALITPRRKPRQLIIALLRKHTLVMSREILDELLNVMSRPEITELRKVKPSQINRLALTIIRKSETVTITSHIKAVLKDPDDDMVINTAISGRARYIVTGDRHLLSIKQVEGVDIVTVSQMLEVIEPLP